VQDPVHGGRVVHAGLGPLPVDLAPQLRDEPHPLTGRQLSLLGQVADPAQIVVDDLVALDPHEVPSGEAYLQN
jgi:hypothetical protein